MPYIRQDVRNAIGLPLCDLPITTAGELNYAISALCHLYLVEKEMSYTLLNEVIGVLESARLEFYRTIVAPYEDQKRAENGKVSEFDKSTNV